MENRAIIKRRKFVGKPGAVRKYLDKLEEEKLKAQKKGPSFLEPTKSFCGSSKTPKPEPLQKCMTEDEKVKK